MLSKLQLILSQTQSRSKLVAVGLLSVLMISFFYYSSKIDLINKSDGKSSYGYSLSGNSINAENTDQNFDVKISPTSFNLSSLDQKHDYQVSYSLNHIDVNGDALAMKSKPTFEAEDDKLSENHQEFSINYTNTPKGLRQDFVIKKGPTKNVSIKVNLDLNTDLEAYQKDKYSVGLKSSENDAINLQYKDLLVYDANGKFLNCAMELEKKSDGIYTIALTASADEVAYPITVDPLSTSNTSFESSIDSTYTGFAVSGNCDINDDGFCDAVIGSYGFKSQDIFNSGKIDVFLGSATGINLTGTPDLTITGGVAINKPGFSSINIGSKFGYSLDCAGDVNDDGYDDIIVGAPSTSMIDTAGTANDTLLEVGAFYIYYGSATGLSLTGVDTVYGTLDTMALGYKVAGLGNLNGSGGSDVMVSAPGFDNAKGVVYVYQGIATTGLDVSPIKTLVGVANGEYYGTALSGPGDINGDGLNDLLIGAHHYTHIAGSRRDTSAGLAHLYLGHATTISSTPAWQAVGQHKNAQFGFSLSGAGNFDGLARNDVIVGSNQYNPSYVTNMPDTILCETPDTLSTGTFNCYGSGPGQGAVYLFSGTNTGLSSSVTTLFTNGEAGSGFGSSVSEAGDLDGDGKPDILIGAPLLSRGDIANQGAVFAYYGKNFVNIEDTTFDWCSLGEKANSFLGVSVDKFGGCGMTTDTLGIIAGAFGYNGLSNLDNLLRGAAFVFKKGDCGLVKYDKPQFLRFPSDTIFVDAETDTCGANVSFLRPIAGYNCVGSLTLLTGIDSSGFFPIGVNQVKYRISSEGQNIDSSFYIVVTDGQSPMPVVCPEVVNVLLPAGTQQTAITWSNPTFKDNHMCSGGGVLSIVQTSGVAKNSVQPVGVYPIVYKATDQAGNESFCTFRVIVSKVSADGLDCQGKSLTSNLNIPQSTNPAANVEVGEKLSDRISFNNSNFGLNLLFSLFEGATGLSLPSWIKAALGQSGTGVNLAFVSVSFSFLPSLDIEYGAYYNLRESTPLKMAVNYSGQVCSRKEPDKLYGCRDTIDFATSFVVDRNPANTFLQVTPGEMKQVLGVYLRNFSFRWRISISVSACIGVPLCIPFVGCAGCAGYRASYSQGVDVFEPINLLTGSSAVRLDLISVCNNSFRQGAGILSVLTCLGVGGPERFVTELKNKLPSGPGGLPTIDPFSYDKSKDEFVFDPNVLPTIGNSIPEMNIRFGRLTNGETVTDPGFAPRTLPKEMGPTSIDGTTLKVSGREKSLISATLDVFSLLAYAIPEPTKMALLCKGIDIGTKTIDIGRPVRDTVAGVPRCKVSPNVLSIDVVDVNMILRSDYNVNYSYNPTITVDSMDLGVPTYWHRPTTGQTGISRYIANVGMDENIKIRVPDGQVDPYFIGNTFRAAGRFIGSETKTQKIDLGINVLEFESTKIIPKAFGPLISLGPYNLFTLGTKPVRNIDVNNIPIPKFSATVTMTPDDIPPVIACKDTTVYLDANGFAFLNHEAAFDRANSFDLPIGGSGKLNFIGGYPDTIFCSDYPSTFGYIIVEDDNCNFDTCQYVVTVEDNILPQMGCVDIVVGIGENGTYEVNPDEIAIGVTDNCRDLEVISTPDIFYCDDVGIPQLVTILVTDIAGNTNSCQAMVTVVDTMPLLLECPYLLNYPVYRNTRDGLCVYTAGLIEFRPHLVAPDCNTVITYTLTGATTGSGNSNVAGVNFNLGSTTITYTATDESGNSTSCSFVVIVEDRENPIVTCPADITIGTNHDMAGDYDCATDYTWNHPVPSDNCTVIAYDVKYTFPDGTTESVDLQSRYLTNTLSETKNFPLGITTIEYDVVDTMNNTATCSFEINVIDDELPILYCEDVIACQTYTYEGNMDIKPSDITRFTINVPNNINISDINVSLQGSAINLGQLSFALMSPTGTIVPLFGSLCTNTMTFNLTVDDEALTAVGSAPCNPLGNGGSFVPTSALSSFDTQLSGGNWQLIATNNNSLSCGTLDKFEIMVCGNSINAMMDTKVSLVTDEANCEYTVVETNLDPLFEDNCAGTVLTHNYIFAPSNGTLAGAVFPLGTTTVVWTATDAAGNTRTCTIIYEVKDQSKPVFINCPEPDVIQEAEPNTCGAFVNFALPLAFDDCDGQLVVEQIDTTGLATGSVFPVGMTILTYMATDSSGNTATCSVRVIVNDTQNGSFACPQNTTRSNDLWKCSALVNGIAPSNVIDNCAQNATITYSIEYPTNSGIIVDGGVKDASGSVFQKGISTVTYKMSSQPSLLITEVSQDIDAPIGGMSPLPYTVITNDDYVELTNFGPSDYNISGLMIERFGAGFSDVFEVPNTTILPAGQTLVVHFGNGVDIPSSFFFNVPCATDLTSGQQAGYVISFKNRVLDAVAINGYNPIGNAITAPITALDWTGNISSALGRGGVIRKFSFDHHQAKDWVVTENCYPLTIGSVNPDLGVYAPNGNITSLQSIMPHMQTCSFTVTVEDAEAPFCAEIDNVKTFTGTATSGGFDSCNESQIFVPAADDCIISDLNVSLVGSIFGADSVFVTLTSPAGKTVSLMTRPCPGSPDINIPINLIFDDQSTRSLAANACGTASWTQDFRPQGGVLLDFYGQKSAGVWTLTVGALPNSDSQVNITSWSLNMNCLKPFQMDDVVINNQVGNCSAPFSWVHPYILDNCFNGTIAVTYTTTDADCVPTNNTLPEFGGQPVTQTFCVGTTTVTYTLTDTEGNINSCSFDVTVIDAELPVINPINCRDYAIQLNPSQCDSVLIFDTNPLTVGTDNCSIVTVNYSPASGTAFPIGTTTVTLTITDAEGNSTSCAFDVVVTEFIPLNNTFACNNQINLSLDQNCEGTIVPDMILEGDLYRCFENYCIVITTLEGLPHANLFTLDDIGKTFKVAISDCMGDANACWGYVKIEDKLLPLVACPKDITVYCGDETTPDFTGRPELLSCEPGATITFSDNVESFGLCKTPQSIIYRTWVIDDGNGNAVECNQEIEIIQIDLDSIAWPKDIEIDQPLECSDVLNDPTLSAPENTGFPKIRDRYLPLGNQCMISIIKSDEIFPLCGGAYVITRTWKVLNACKPLDQTNPRVHVQAIKVFDTTAPKLYPCPNDTIVSTAPWACMATNIVCPVPTKLEDLCSDVDLKVSVFGGGYARITGSYASNNLAIRAFNLSIGNHEIIYKATDKCGNQVTCSYVIKVVDSTPPTPITKRSIVLGLTPGYDSNGNADGQAKLFTSAIDNGSYDNCTPVRMEIRRDEGPSCGSIGSNGHNNNTTFNNKLAANLANNMPYSANDNDGGEFVKFCCEDARTAGADFDGDGTLDIGYHKVVMRVWDDGNRDGVIGNIGDNFNDSWSIVKVEEKAAPVIQCPTDATINCDWAIETFESSSATKSISGVDFSKTGVPTAYDVCNLSSIEFRDKLELNDCGIGTIVRTFVTTSGNSTQTCRQIITVLPSQSQQVWVLNLPSNWDEVLPVGCDGPSQSDIEAAGPISLSGPCDVIGVNHKISQFDFEQGVCRKWKVEYNFTNWCTDEKREGYIKYFIFEDTQSPLIACTDTMFVVNNDCEFIGSLTKSATDDGGCIGNDPNRWLKWTVFVDLWADGTKDYEYTSFIEAGNDVNNMNGGNWSAITDDNGNGIPDIYLAPTKDDALITGLKLPTIDGNMSTHKVEWKVTDGCHNFSSCIETFMVVDKKAPTPICVPLSTALMADPDGAGPRLAMVELEGCDFIVKASDNCTAEGNLLFTFDETAPQVTNKTLAGPTPNVINLNVAHYFDKTGALAPYPIRNIAADKAVEDKYFRGEGDIQRWDPSTGCASKVWSSNSLVAGQDKTDVDVKVSVWDAKFNTDYCWSKVSLILNASAVTASGSTKTEANHAVVNVDVVANANLPEYPKTTKSDENGLYSITALGETTITASKDGDDINGVTTLDLVFIQRHILGLAPLTSPYQMIAADATNDGKVTASDLTEIRKLILGVSTEFTKNSSWRFPSKGQNLNTTTPFPFVEKIIVNPGVTSMTDKDFVAVKIGDINGTATLNGANNNTNARSASYFDMYMDKLEPGLEGRISIPIRAQQASDIFGLQTTLDINNGTFVEIVPGALNVTAENVGIHAKAKKVTFSYASKELTKLNANDVLFTLVLDIDKNHTSSNVSMTATDEITTSESYVGANIEVSKLRLNTLQSGGDIVLYQNEPNPFKDFTTVSFDMPKDGPVSLSITDANGKLMITKEINAVKGLNQELITKAQVGPSGIYFYTITVGEFTATKKMILVE